MSRMMVFFLQFYRPCKLLHIITHDGTSAWNFGLFIRNIKTDLQQRQIRTYASKKREREGLNYSHFKP